MPEVPATPPSANEEETLPRHNIRYSLQIINQSYPLPIERSLSEPALTNHNNDDKTTTTPSLESLPNRDLASNPSYREQIATFQVLFHSGIIGLNLGTSSSTQLKSLFIVLVFHQAFEGNLLPSPKFPKKSPSVTYHAQTGTKPRKKVFWKWRIANSTSTLRIQPWCPPLRHHLPPKKCWIKWALSAFYGLITPIAIGIGIAIRQLYDPASQTAQIVSGVLDTVSAGILLYMGLVELLAREILFSEEVRGKGGMVGWVLVGLRWDGLVGICRVLGWALVEW